MTDAPAQDQQQLAADSCSVAEFKEYLDKMEAHFNSRIDRASNEEREKKGDLPLGAYLVRQKDHERLRDIEVVRSMLADFEQYIE